MTGSSGTRITFFGFGAYVGSLKGPTHCEWWPDDPTSFNWSAAALVPTDLSKNPTAARAGSISIADIQCDDHRTDGGLTAIGPRFPQGSMVGGLWLSETYWSSLGKNQPQRSATKDAHDYELTSHLYESGPLKGRRFFGLHSKVHATNGPLTRVEIWHPGRSKVPGERSVGVFWLDLAQVADPDTSEVGAKAAEGALFLDDLTSRQLSLMAPKLPKSAGFDPLF